MRKDMKSKKIMKYVIAMFVLAMTLAGSITLPGKAAEATFATSQVLDATEDVAYCDGTNPNKVESLGVKFGNMTVEKGDAIGIPLPFEKNVLVAGEPSSEKTALVLQFTKPIDANKVEYLTLNMFAGKGAKIRVYDANTKNFVEDTAKDVLYFTDWDIEAKTLILKKYADKDGMVRNITFYFASVELERNLTIDSFEFEAYKTVDSDYTMKAAVNTYDAQDNLGKNQVPTFYLNDKGLLKDLGWDGAVYVDTAEDRILKPGKYITLKFDQINTKDYETVTIDFYSPIELDYTFYVYSADEMVYSEETVDQVVKVKGREITKITLETKNFADEYGYMSEVNILMAKHNGEKGSGAQVFFGDVTFRLPREYANVTVYTEKIGGGYQKSDISFQIEGFAGEKVNITPYSADEIGLYGYVYNGSAKNILSGILKDGEVLDLRIYYKLRTFTVTINNDGEKTTEKMTYGSTLDLMKYRKENMLMNILVDGLAVEELKTTITSDCVIDITQTPGNYIFFMVDGELFATRIYTPDDISYEEPTVPLKKGYVGEWEAYELNGTDVTVNAVYTESKAPVESGNNGNNVLINVANKMKGISGNGVVRTILMTAGALVLVAALVVLCVILVRKGVLGKRGLIIGGSALAACCVAVCLVLFWDVIIPDKNASNVANTKFDKLYSSDKEQAIKPDETLSFAIDKELKDKNYIQIDVDTNVNLLGTIEYYNMANKEESNVEEFFIEGASEEVFYQFLDNFRDNGAGRFEKHLTKITLTNVSEEEGKVTVKEVGISDRIIDLTKAELYVENEYLKVGMDLLCGGALTYIESLPQDGKVLQEIIDADGTVKVGLNYGEREGAQLLSESVNLINIYDKGREVQQSFYADVNEEHGYKRGTYIAQNNKDWPYNPVQGGDQDDNSSQIIDYRVEDNLLYVKTRAMDWGQHNSTTKSYMENWYSLDDDMLIVKNRFIDWNGFEGEVASAINCEMPAVYFAQALNTFVTYDGTAPWTGSTLDRQSNLGDWAQGAYVTNNPTEGWFAWVNEDDYGIGMYVPGIPFYASGRSTATTSASEKLNSNAKESSMLTSYRPKNTSDYTQCYVINTDYTAPVITTTMDQYVPLEYSYVIRINNVDNLRSGFQAMDQNGTIDNSGMNAWDD